MHVQMVMVLCAALLLSLPGQISVWTETDLRAALAERTVEGRMTPGIIDLPAGVIELSDPVILLNADGVVLRGKGERATTLRFTRPLPGPAVQLVNAKVCRIEDLSIRSEAGTTGVAIQSLVDGAQAPGGRLAAKDYPRQLTLRHVQIGNTDLGFTGRAEFQAGVAFACAGDRWDGNNDASHLEAVSFGAIEGAAIRILHANSLGHSISDPWMYRVGTAVECAGGSFQLQGGYISALDTDFIFRPPQTKRPDGRPHGYYHASTIASTTFEGPSNFIRADALDAPMSGDGLLGLQVMVVNISKKGAQPRSDAGLGQAIRWAAPGSLRISNSFLNFGVDTTLSFMNPGASVDLRGCTLTKVRKVSWQGRFLAHENTWRGGVGEFVRSPGAQLLTRGDVNENKDRKLKESAGD